LSIAVVWLKYAKKDSFDSFHYAQITDKTLKQVQGDVLNFRISCWCVMPNLFRHLCHILIMLHLFEVGAQNGNDLEN